MPTARSLTRSARRLGLEVDALEFQSPVAVVYNPLVYAFAAHAQYLGKYADGPRRVVFLGMNPGPWGMSQTGIPFGDVRTVRDWLRIDAAVKPPARTHPARPVEGLDTSRVEVSGRRLWGLMRERWREPRIFFRDHFVANYCPLMFLDDSGRNITPDRLPARERGPMMEICDRHLARLLTTLETVWLVGVGSFAAASGRRVVREHGLKCVEVAQIPHPSPASPLANTGWAPLAQKCLVDLGIWKES